MKSRILLFQILFFLFYTNLAFCHKNIIEKVTEKNVTVYFDSPYYYEYVKSVKIIAEKGSQICESYKYNKEIVVDFTDYPYESDFKTEYFVSIYSNIFKENKFSQDYTKILKDSTLLIKVFSHDFEIVDILKLIEKSIINYGLICSNQKLESINTKFIKQTHFSINDSLIYDWLNSVPSDSFRDIINIESEIKIDEKYSYFWKNGDYYFYDKGKLFFESDEIYFVCYFESIGVVIFNNSTTFQFYDFKKQNWVTKLSR